MMQARRSLLMGTLLEFSPVALEVISGIPVAMVERPTEREVFGRARRIRLSRCSKWFLLVICSTNSRKRSLKMSEILTPETIELRARVSSRDEAIRRAGRLLVENGNVEERYVDSMFEREESVSTFMGNAVAIPHGTNDSKQWVARSGLSVITLPEGVEYGDGNVAKLIIGIAGKGDEHIDLLSKIALIVSEEENVEKIVQAETKEQLMAMFDEAH